MEKIVEEKTIQNYRWKSIDGQIWDKEEDCKAWEESYQGTMEYSAKQKATQISPSLYGIPNAFDDQECYAALPKTLNDIALYNAWIDCVTQRPNSHLLNDKMINKLIYINFGYDRDYCEVYDAEEIILNIKEHVGEILTYLNEKIGDDLNDK